MSDPIFRPAEIADKGAIAACNRAAFGEFAQRVGYDPKPMVADYGQLITEGHVRVLESDAEIIGVLVLLPE